MQHFLLLAALLGGTLLAAADTPINLLQTGKFEPVIMHGKPSAARGWYLFDTPRENYIKKSRSYISGEDCFKLEFGPDGTFAFRFTDPLAAPYRETPAFLTFGSRVGWPPPPARFYRVTGRIRCEGGKVVIGGRTLKPAPEWQQVDFQTTYAPQQIRFMPTAGGAYFGFADLDVAAVYPKVGGEIALPDGGKLTRFLLPENASYLVRWSVALWRGWFWQLTGVALPIETVKEVKPTPGAFAAVKGKVEVPGGWQLTVGKNGISLVYGEETSIAPALFDYLRLGLGCAFYSKDYQKLPPEPVKALAAIDRVAKPKFRYFTGDRNWNAMSGGVTLPLIYTRNDVDYYHLFEPRNDHILNVILPMELYFKSHPEYFMMDRTGKRPYRYYPYHTNPCFSNPEASRIMHDELLNYVKGQTLAKQIIFDVGDISDHCLCPQCIAFNGGKESNTDSQFDFANRFARTLAKEFPDMMLTRGAYMSRHLPPRKITKTEPNINFGYCLTNFVLPCTLHLDCEPNKKGLAEIELWNRYAGGNASRLGFLTYRDIRPIAFLRQAEYINRFGTGSLYMFNWKGFSDAIPFVVGRWNLGEDPQKLVEEFDLNYYGAGGKYIHEINLLIDEYARNYKHKPGDENPKRYFTHYAIWGGDPETITCLDRATLDRVYALIDKALAAVGDSDPGARKRILAEKRHYIAEDLIRYNRFACKSKAELDAFAARLADLVRTARQHPEAYRNITPGVDARRFIAGVSGIAIPNTKKHWTQEEMAEKILKDPISLLQANPKKIPGGYYFNPLTLRGDRAPTVYNYQCPPRTEVPLSRPSIGTPAVRAILRLDRAPKAPSFLAVEGLDDDKPGRSTFRITVNGVEIHNGPNAFPDKSWGRMGFSIPAGVLKAGENEILIRDTTPDLPSRSANFSDDERGKNDPQWGWIGISEVYWLDPNGEFENALAGKEKKPLWHCGAESPQYRPRGTVNAGNGKLELIGGDAQRTGVIFFGHDHNLPKIAYTPGSKFRMKITASGEGVLRMGLWSYRGAPTPKKGSAFPLIGYAGKTNYSGATVSEPCRLTAEPQTFERVITPIKGAGLIIPEFFVEGKSRAVVTALEMEVLPPKP